MNKNKMRFIYNSFDVVSLICVLLDNDNKYNVKYNKDNSQIIITRQIKNEKDN